MDVFKRIQVTRLPKNCPICDNPNHLLIEQPKQPDNPRWICLVCGQPLYLGRKTFNDDHIFNCYIYIRLGWGIGSYRLYTSYNLQTGEFSAIEQNNQEANYHVAELSDNLVKILTDAQNINYFINVKNDSDRYIYDVAIYKFTFYLGNKCNKLVCYAEDFKDFPALRKLKELKDVVTPF